MEKGQEKRRRMRKQTWKKQVCVWEGVIGRGRKREQQFNLPGHGCFLFF